jgi:hypothetical protein
MMISSLYVRAQSEFFFGFGNLLTFLPRPASSLLHLISLIPSLLFHICAFLSSPSYLSLFSLLFPNICSFLFRFEVSESVIQGKIVENEIFLVMPNPF